MEIEPKYILTHNDISDLSLANPTGLGVHIDKLPASTEDITRFEIVDHTECDKCFGSGLVPLRDTPGISYSCPTCDGNGTIGRRVVFFDPSKKVELSLQDDGRTLKVFVSKRND